MVLCIPVAKKKKKKKLCGSELSVELQNIYNYFPTGYVHFPLLNWHFSIFHFWPNCPIFYVTNFSEWKHFHLVKEKPGIKFDFHICYISQVQSITKGLLSMLFNSPNCPLLSSCSVPALARQSSPDISYLVPLNPLLITPVHIFFIPLKIIILKCHSHRSKFSWYLYPVWM